MPCSDHAVLLKTTAQHVRRVTACGLPARVRLLPATTRSSTKIVIRSIPISDAGGQCETKQRLSWMRKTMVTAHYKKDDLLYWWNICSEISGYHAEISRRTRHCRSRAGGAAWHVWINGTTWQGSSIGTAWARHAMCEPAFSITKSLQESASTDRVQSSSSARCRHYQLWNRADCKLYISAPCIVIHICEKVEQDEHFLLTIYFT